MTTSRWRSWLNTLGLGSAKSPDSRDNSTPGFERRVYLHLNTCSISGEFDRHSQSHRSYTTNEIRTAKYNLVTFVPKNLFEQFRRVANLYFLFLIILQMIPAVSEGSAVLSALSLGFILAITAAKDGYEDWKRYQSDAEINNQLSHVLRRDRSSGSFRRSFAHYRTKLSGEGNAGCSKTLELTPPTTTDPRTRTTIASDVPSSPHIGASPTEKSRLVPTASEAIGHESHWDPIRWRSVKVGDIILLRNDDPIPADMIVLATSDADGVCYVETKNLDGETNLKLRQSVSVTNEWRTVDHMRSSELYIDCEAPNTNLYTFKGSLIHYTESTSNQEVAVDSDEVGKAQAEPVTIDNILLRGCVIRNTDYVVGLVLYTGLDTKIVLNSGVTPSKRSRIERIMNTHVSLNFVLLFILCLLCAICSGFLYTQSNSTQSVFQLVFEPDPDSAGFVGFLTFWSGLILFQTIVPISLYVSIELVKSIQAYFIYCDLDMYYEPLDRPCMPKTWNISDDLGQVQYIFSDKTGTLTQNIMEFRQCSIRGTVYGELFDPPEEEEKEGGMEHDSPSIIAPSPAIHEGFPSIFAQRLLYASNGGDPFSDTPLPPPTTQTPTVPSTMTSPESEKLPSSESGLSFEEAKRVMLTDMNGMFRNKYFNEEELTFVDTKLYRHLAADDTQARVIVEFFTILAVCHTVLAETPDPDNSNRIVYKAQSPDEAALVSAARNAGFTFLGREQDTIHCEFLGRPQQFELLNVLEFNSTRKRMSVIVRRTDGRIVLFCKGADSIIFQRLRAGQFKVKEDTLEHLKYFATSGLRTLCLGYRIISSEEYDAWATEYKAASNLLDGREEALDAANEKIEHNLTLVGGTAIEDRLQDGVPEAIAQLATAGIKIWVLTGDKTETAINIGFSCNLLYDGMQLVVVTGTDAESTRVQLQDALDLFGYQQGRLHEPPPTEKVDEKSPSANGVLPNGGGRRQQQTSGPEGVGEGEQPGLDSAGNKKPLALVIDGESLKYALEPELELVFLKVARMCESVVCCRVSPLQKALVVRCVKQNLKVLCLAIGDGANDVSMIQEADIGVGIAGEEGLQAVLASDYSIAQFRFLQRLLLVHGRWSYIRVANMILIFFYKNIVWTFALFWFQIWCDFSLTFLFDYALMMFYNLLFTSLPVLVLGVLDQDVAPEVSMSVPQLYLAGIKGTQYSMRRFWLHVLDGIYQSLACVLIPFYVYGVSGTSRSGGLDDAELNEMGTIVSVGVVCVANLYVAINMMNWTWIVPMVTVLSTLSFSLFLGVYCRLNVSSLYLIDTQVYTQGNFYFVVALVIVVCMFPRLFGKFIHENFFPNDVHIVREVVHRFHKLYPEQTRQASSRLLARKKSEKVLSPQCIPLTAPSIASSPCSPDSVSIHRTTSYGSRVISGSGLALTTADPYTRPDVTGDDEMRLDAPGGRTSLTSHLQRMSSISSIGPAASHRQRSTRRKPFTSVMHRLKQRSLFFLRSGQQRPNTGFAYSQHHQSSLSLRYSYAPFERSVEVPLPPSDTHYQRRSQQRIFASTPHLPSDRRRS